MEQCNGTTAKGDRCSRLAKAGGFCWQHAVPTTNIVKQALVLTAPTVKISGGRTIGNTNLLDSTDSKAWEDEYARVMDKKYAKGTRNFSMTLTGKAWIKSDKAPIFLIPRERGGPSYKSQKLEGVEPDDVQYCPISKGYPMQDVSSFTLGPIVGEGLCLVNAAFSKCVCVMHIEGNGIFDSSRKCFWKASKKPLRQIVVTSKDTMTVDGQSFNIHQWLKSNESLWLSEWDKWHRAIAMCSMGDFHWANENPTIAYRFKGEYINFVEWKKLCYIKPSYELMPATKVFQFLLAAWKTAKVPLGLVHPKAISDKPETPITAEYLSELFNSPNEMCCQPFVVAGLLMGVDV